MPKTLEKKQDRPSWDEYFMQVANVVKSRSTCLSSAKGAVLVNGRQIVSTGYNGTPAGTKHCDEGGCARCLAVKEGRLKSGRTWKRAPAFEGTRFSWAIINRFQNIWSGTASWGCTS